VAIASAGYAGTVTQEDWAVMAQLTGYDTAVVAATDCVVEGAAGTRVITVSPGTAWGWGVLDTLSGTNSVSLAANGTGATRWDAIVLRRNWSTKVTTLAAVTGSSSPTIPTLTVNPGVQADQVLALVAVPAGATDLTGATVRRYTQWPVQMTAGAYAPHNPSHMQRWVDSATGVVYQWSGSAWIDPLNPAWQVQTLASGMEGEGISPAARLVLGQVQLRGRVMRVGGYFIADWSPTLFTLPASLRPPSLIRGIVAMSGPSGWGSLEIASTGIVRVWCPTGAQHTGVNLTGFQFYKA